MIKQFNLYGKNRYDLDQHNERFIDIDTFMAYEIFKEGYKAGKDNKMILKCNCDNEYQDKQYGKKNRVHNIATKSNRSIFKCTVCNEEKTTIQVSEE